MGKIIYYDEYARYLCRKEEKIFEATGTIPDKLFNRITKIFQWDLELDRICK